MSFRSLLLGGLLCVLVPTGVRAQALSTVDRERVFAFKVKQIDEFFERFDNDKDLLIKKYIKEHGNNAAVTRQVLIGSLFLSDNTVINQTDKTAFIRQVTTRENPGYLDFFGPGWYAQVCCRCKYKAKDIYVFLVLRILRDTSGGSSWIIISASAKDLPQEKGSTFTLHNPVDKTRFITPISHAANFIGLSAALADKKNIEDYLDESFTRRPASMAFLAALLKGDLEYGFVKSIRYHFLQVDGWIFTVNQYEREMENSGWLISHLVRASNADKERYTAQLLQTTY